MKVLSSKFLFLTICVIALLSGCGSSSSTPSGDLQSDPTDSGLQEDPMDTGPDTGSDVVPDTGPDVVPDTGPDVVPDTEPDVVPDTEPDVVPDTEPDVVPDTGPDVVPDTGPDAGPDTGPDAGPDTEEPPTSGIEMLVPAVTAGSDLDRLIKGIKRQVALTLLDLNQRLSGGVPLTDQQETCLGAFDPAVGEQLLAIDCEQALATGDVKVFVAEAAFYATDECHASLFNGNADNCQLQRASITLPDLWRVPEGERRPIVVYAGSNVTYALMDTKLQIENSEPALAGPFKCDIELTNSSSSTPLDGTSCASIIASTAEHLDEVVPD